MKIESWLSRSEIFMVNTITITLNLVSNTLLILM